MGSYPQLYIYTRSLILLSMNRFIKIMLSSPNSS